MSLIQKMLEDLDRGDSVADKASSRPVRAFPMRTAADEWLWRVVALLMMAAVLWVSWVAYQLRAQPPLATGEALRAEEFRARTVVASPVPASSPPPATTFRLARSIETPIPEISAKPVPMPETADVSTAPPRKAVAATVKRRNEARVNLPSAATRAEAEFHNGVDLFKRGRSAEAEKAFRRSLQFDASHQGARQALIVLHLERGEIETASRVLNEGVAKDVQRGSRLSSRASSSSGTATLPGP